MAETYTKEKIILRLKELNNELRQCQTYDEVDLCRQKLLATISEIPSLNKLYNSKIKEVERIINNGEYKIVIDSLLEQVTKKNNLDNCIAGGKIKIETSSRAKLFTYNQNVVADIPSLLFLPSLALIHATDDFFPDDYQKRDNELSTLYYKFGDSFSKIFLNFRFKEIYLELPLIKSEKYSAVNFKNFNTAFLYAVTYRTNLVLQNLIKEKWNDTQQSSRSGGTQPNNNLTNRENEIYNLLKEHNYTAREIANKLNLSQRTVENHISAILSKTGISSKRNI